mgnify:CR=1 FL=1
MRKRATWIGAALAVLALVGLFAGCLTFFGTQNEVVFHFNDQEQPVTVKAHDEPLRTLLEKAGLDPEEVAARYECDLPLEAVINQDTQVHFRRIYQVTLTEAGKTRAYETTRQSVEAFLREQGISLNPLDEINIKPNAPIADAMHIVIDRIEKKSEEQKEILPFKTVYKKDSQLVKGKERVEKEGKNGYRTIELIHTFKNGEKINTERKVLEEVQPQNKIVLVGTKAEPRTDRSRLVASRSSSRDRAASSAEGTKTVAGMPYKKSIRVVATAYTHTGNRTATGVYPRRGTVAVDPRVIPYGTRLYIPGYGVGIAQDTGSAIVGNRIDLFYETAREAYRWGMRTVTIYILE